MYEVEADGDLLTSSLVEAADRHAFVQVRVEDVVQERSDHWGGWLEDRG